MLVYMIVYNDTIIMALAKASALIYLSLSF